MKSTCEICKYYLQNICGGVGDICEDYYKVPQISKDEKKYWEKEGDASKYRKQFWVRKCRGGYSIEYIQ